METFVTNIKKTYRDRAINYDEERWPPNHSGRLLRLELVVKKKGEHFFASRSENIGEKNFKQYLIAYGDLFKKQVRKVLVEGSAGIGKTSLCISISKDWADGELFKEYKLLLLLPLHQEKVALAGSLSKLIESFMLQVNAQSIVSCLEEKKGEGVMIIADGWNKLDESKRQKGTFLYNLLFGDALSLASVIVTSRPTASAPLHNDSHIDPLFVEIRGFKKEGIREFIQSEFVGNQQTADHLLEQLAYNPLIENICSVPLICSIICRLALDKALPPTMTELCAKVISSIVNHSVQKADTPVAVSSMQEISALPESLQESWWHLCQHAFQAIHTSQVNHSQLESVRFSIGIEVVALVDYVTHEKHSVTSLNFIHPTIQEYLAASHLVKQPPEAQLKAMETIKSEQITSFWRFLFGQCSKYDQKNVLKHAIRVLSADVYSRSLLCQCAFEARNDSVVNDIVKALSLKTNSKVHFGDPHTAYDCEAIIYIIDNIQGSECDGMIINFSSCSLGEKQIMKVADILYKKAKTLQVKDLDMSDNGLSDNCVADLFHKAITAFQSLEKLFLHNNKIGVKGISAIMAALAESPSQSVMQLDLSFNPLTVTGLQLLHDGIFSGSLANLEILFLQGSLTADADFNIQYLTAFAKGLLLHCPHLRRLDLSSNDLGEPGTPDVCTVTSQLIGHDKNLDLRLNREYMAEVDDNFIAIMEESVRRKGTIDHTAVHGVIVGPGRSGKNSLMNRLMGEGPPDPDNISPSTGVLENIVKVEVKKLCTVAAAVNNLIWKRLDYDEEALELIMTTAKSHTTSENDNVASNVFNSHERVSSAVIEVQSTDASATPSSASTSNILKLDKGSVVHMQSDNSDLKGKSVAHSLDDLAHDRPLDIFKRAVKLRRMDALREHLESSWSLYLTNTGGQMEFQELLPLLVCGPSVFFITFPLDRNLQEHYTVKYQYPDGSEKTYKSPSTLMDEILQTLATIAALDNTGPLLQYGTDLKPKVFFVGTHKDRLPESLLESAIQMIDQQLQEKVRQTSLFHQGSIEFAVGSDQLMFAVNNLDTDDTDFQKIRSALQQAVERYEEFTVQCPSTWLIFSLVLRAKHKSSQILSYQDCFTIAQECGISDRAELNNALVFIHTRLGLLRYFCVEELNRLVVIDPQILFDTITKLIVETFTSDHAKINEIEEFQKRGILSMKVMERISKKKHSDTQLPFKWLLKLLNHLGIAAFFIDRNGERKCFFPSVLCHTPEQQPNQSLDCSVIPPPPILIAFKSGFCPRGIPSALIKYLMTNEMKSQITWELHSSRVFRNQVSFGVGPCDIILKILPTHLEICFDPESDTTDNSDVQLTCKETFTQLQQAMIIVTKGYRECDYFFAFYCTKPECRARSHPAKIELDLKKVRCRITERRGPLPQNYDLWLPQNAKTGQYNYSSSNRDICFIRFPIYHFISSMLECRLWCIYLLILNCTGGSVLQRRLDSVLDSDHKGVSKHLGQIVTCMREWEGEIADELGLTQADVASIKSEYPSNLKLQMYDK